MPPKEKLDPQFDDEISFARYIIRNANNFLLLPLDSSTVAQLNDDMRSYCINTSTFINSVKHMLAEHNSPKSFGPISGEEFKNILQLDNTTTSTTTTTTTTITTSNNTNPPEPEIKTKEGSDFENANSSKTDLVNRRITRSTKKAALIKPDIKDPDSTSDSISKKAIEKLSKVSKTANETAIQSEPLSTHISPQITENNTDSPPIAVTTTNTSTTTIPVTTTVGASPPLPQSLPINKNNTQETKNNENTNVEVGNDELSKKINEIAKNKSIKEKESKGDLFFWVNLRQSEIKSKHVTDFSTLNTDDVLVEWLKETVEEIRQLRKELKEYPLETWNINFLKFLKKHRFSIIADKYNKVTASTPFHGLENKFICNLVLPLLFPEYLDAKDSNSLVYYRNIKKRILGANVYVKLHELRTPPLEDLTSEEKIRLWLEKLRPAFHLLTNKLHFDPVYAVSYCISHYSNGEYSKTLKLWRTHPSLKTALSTGAAIFSKLLKVQRSAQNSEGKFSLEHNHEMVGETEKRGSSENNDNKKRSYESTDTESTNAKRPALEKQWESDITKIKPSNSVNNKIVNSTSEKKVIIQSWLNIHANQVNLLKTLDFSNFDEHEIEKYWIKTLGPKILPLFDELDEVKSGESFLKWAYQLIKLLESENFSTVLRHDINTMSDDAITPLHEAEDTFLFERVFKIAFPDYNLPEFASAYNYWEDIKAKMYPHYTELPQLFKNKLQSITVDTLKSKVQLEEWIHTLDEYHCAMYNSTISGKQHILANEFMKYCPPEYYDEVDSWRFKSYIYVANRIVDIMNRINIPMNASKTTQLPTSVNSNMTDKETSTGKPRKVLSINTSEAISNENTKNEISKNDTKNLVTAKTLVINTDSFDYDTISSEESDMKGNSGISNSSQNISRSNTNTTATTTNPNMNSCEKSNDKIINNTIDTNRKIEVKEHMKNIPLGSNQLIINTNDSLTKINTSMSKTQMSTTDNPVTTKTSEKTSKDNTTFNKSVTNVKNNPVATTSVVSADMKAASVIKTIITPTSSEVNSVLSEKKIDKIEPITTSSIKSAQLSQSTVETANKINEPSSIKTTIPQQQTVDITTSTNKVADTMKYTKQATNNSPSTDCVNPSVSKNTSYETSTSYKVNSKASIKSSTINSQNNVTISTNNATSVKSHSDVDHLKSSEKGNIVSIANMTARTPISGSTVPSNTNSEQKLMSSKQSTIPALPLSLQTGSEMSVKKETIKTSLEIDKIDSTVGATTTTANSPQINSTQTVSNRLGSLSQESISIGKNAFTVPKVASITDHKAERTYNLPLAPGASNKKNSLPASSPSTPSVYPTEVAFVDSTLSTSSKQNLYPTRDTHSNVSQHVTKLPTSPKSNPLVVNTSNSSWETNKIVIPTGPKKFSSGTTTHRGSMPTTEERGGASNSSYINKTNDSMNKQDSPKDSSSPNKNRLVINTHNAP